MRGVEFERGVNDALCEGASFSLSGKVNRHHVAFERRAYKTKLELAFRNVGGMVVPMAVEVHQELHAKVEPPLKPEREHMLLALQAINGYTQPLDVIDAVATRLDELGEPMGDNLFRQLEYIKIGLQT